ncbi:MAG: hypothetical protein HY985_02415 [Magnetospirillum sp.]|nr:hypothetical protein [Magnetospirillum sp.]
MGAAGAVESPVVGDGGGALRDKASQLAAQARERLSQAGDITRERVGEWSREARRQAGQAADRSRELYEDHPLTMGAVAVAVGAAIGALLPRTRIESEMMSGETMEQMMSRARSTGGELMERAKRVAGRAVTAAKEEGGEAVRKVKETAKGEAGLMH